MGGRYLSKVEQLFIIPALKYADIDALTRMSFLRKNIGHNRLSVRLSLRSWLDSLLAEFHSLLPEKNRRFRAYVVGLPKSGTTSLAEVFTPAYRAAHEGRPIRSIVNLLDWKRGYTNDWKIKRQLRYRDKRLGLEFESAHYLCHVAEHLVEMFPESKFILTYREPVAWLESQINQRLEARGAAHWDALQEWRLGRYGHSFELSELEQMRGVYPVSSYLSYWHDHVSHVLETVPPERLLAIQTSKLSSSITEVATFVGADPELLDGSRSHSYRRPEKSFRLPEAVEDEWLARKVRLHCGDLIRNHFPELLDEIPYLKSFRR